MQCMEILNAFTTFTIIFCIHCWRKKTRNAFCSRLNSLCFTVAILCRLVLCLAENKYIVSKFFSPLHDCWFTLVIMQFMNIPNTIELFNEKQKMHSLQHWILLIVDAITFDYVFAFKTFSRSMFWLKCLENSTKIVLWIIFQAINVARWEKHIFFM